MRSINDGAADVPEARADAGAPLGAVRASILEDWRTIAELGAEWDELLDRAAANTIFLTREWLAAWRKAAGATAHPWVVAARDAEGRLVGLAPFYRASFRVGGVIPFRVLRPLGDAMSGAEYPDLILDPRRERETAAAIGEAQGARRDWDCLWMPNVAGWTGALDRLSTVCRASRFLLNHRPRDFAALGLPDTYAAFLSSLSGNTRGSLQRRSRKLLSDPGVALAECRNVDELPGWLDALFDLNHRRWTAAGSVGNFVRKPQEARFYREFAPLALARGWLRLYGLRVAGSLRAVQIGYVYRGTFFQLQEGFDPAAPAGLGNVLRGLVIERCIKEGVQSYDFLGEHTEHKRRWGAQLRWGHDILIGRRSARNTLLFKAKLWPTGRFLRPVPPP